MTERNEGAGTGQPPADDRELMELRADTLFTCDARGRIVRSNDPDGGAAPRLFLGHTAAGRVVRISAALPETDAGRLAALAAGLPETDPIRPAADALAPVREALARLAPVADEHGGPAYRFPAAPPQAPVGASAGGAVRLTEGNLALVRDTFPWLSDALAAWAPCFAVVRDGAAVSVCFTSRNGAHAAEAGVETLPDFRGRGHATTAVLAWGAFVAATGRAPLYSTGWTNLASQGVARRAGLVQFGADVSWY